MSEQKPSNDNRHSYDWWYNVFDPDDPDENDSEGDDKEESEDSRSEKQSNK
jgi:hypothetical protein